MKELLLRFGSLTLLIFILLYQSYQSNDPMVSVFIVLTIILVLYFLLPVFKKPIVNYLMIVSLFLIVAFLNLQMEYWLILLSFFLLDGTFNLMTREFFIYIFYVLLLLITFSIMDVLHLHSLLLFSLLLICTIFLNHYAININEKNELYEQLLLQYRKLKRRSVEQEELVRAEERTKIARDMHDSVGHKLTALLMQLEVMELKNKPTDLHYIKQLARDSLEETRYAVRQLKVNETTGIQSVIQLIRKLEMESNLIIKFTLERGILSIPLTNEQSIVLYRVLQESLTNAMKHSESKEVEVTITLNALQHVHFSVKNKVYAHYPIVQGFGLKNMKERFQEIEGDFRVNKTDQQFIVEGTFPLRSEGK
ncbi:histidine kinase [Ureibacillus sp. MALMAid1270]|uniref:sensor histidine kinase n=1 Tax=Ureibacillus sp. MALMAid1270 TaxID=3411629 RepID=UPI003BA5175C